MASHMHCPSCGGAIRISSDKLSGVCTVCKTTYYFTREEYEQMMHPKQKKDIVKLGNGFDITGEVNVYLYERIEELTKEVFSLRETVDNLTAIVDKLSDNGDIKKN